MCNPVKSMTRCLAFLVLCFPSFLSAADQVAAVQAQIKTLKSGSAEARYAALQALGEMGEAASSAVEPLAAVAGNRKETANLRCEALGALAKIGPAAVTALPVVRQCLKDKDAQVRAYAAKALAGLAPGLGEDANAAAAAADLLRAADDGDASVKREAVRALGEVGANREAVKTKLRTLAAGAAAGGEGDGLKTRAAAALSRLEAKERERAQRAADEQTARAEQAKEEKERKDRQAEQ